MALRDEELQKQITQYQELMNDLLEINDSLGLKDATLQEQLEAIRSKNQEYSPKARFYRVLQLKMGPRRHPRGVQGIQNEPKCVPEASQRRPEDAQECQRSDQEAQSSI